MRPVPMASSRARPWPARSARNSTIGSTTAGAEISCRGRTRRRPPRRSSSSAPRHCARGAPLCTHRPLTETALSRGRAVRRGSRAGGPDPVWADWRHGPRRPKDTAGRGPGIPAVGDGAVPRTVRRRSRPGRRPRAVGVQGRARSGVGGRHRRPAGRQRLHLQPGRHPSRRRPDRPARSIPMAGVSAVGVHPTHRRQGSCAS